MEPSYLKLHSHPVQVWLQVVTSLIGVGVGAWFIVTIYYLRRAWVSLAELPYSSYRLANLILRLQVRGC